MGRKKRGTDAPIEENMVADPSYGVLETVFPDLGESVVLAEGEPESSPLDLDFDNPLEENNSPLLTDDGEGNEIPKLTDPAWQDYVMKQFQPDELAEGGAPLVHGLRRVANLLLGDIIRSEGHVVQPPSFLANSDTLQPAVVEYTVVFRPFHSYEYRDELTFSAVADVSRMNTEADYARFPTAMAETRAEARCLRKALRIKKAAAEEMTMMPVDESAVNGKISPSQVNFIDILARRTNINIASFLRIGKQKFDNIFDVPYSVAQKMVEHLSKLNNDRSLISPEIQPYDSNWRNS